MEKVSKVKIISKKEKENYFEYCIQLKNRTVIAFESSLDLNVGNEIFVSYDFQDNKYINIKAM